MLARLLMFAIAFSSCGCASYVTPGGPVNLGDINRADVKEAASRKPSPNFPARLAIARVQAPGYQSYSFKGYGSGGFTVLTTQELMTDEQTESIAAWPMIAGVAPINRMLLPATMDSLDDLRASAAKVQADV